MAYFLLPALPVLILILALIGFLVTLPWWLYATVGLLAFGIIYGVRTWHKKTEPNFPIRTLR